MKIILTTTSKLQSADKVKLQNYDIYFIGSNVVKRENKPVLAKKLLVALSCQWLTSHIAKGNTATQEEIKTHYKNNLDLVNSVVLFKILRSLGKDIILSVTDNQVVMLEVLHDWIKSKDKKVNVQKFF